jgi:hypothetical protein
MKTLISFTIHKNESNRPTSLLAENSRRLTMAAETEVNATMPTFWELLAEKLARQPELLAVARGN